MNFDALPGNVVRLSNAKNNIVIETQNPSDMDDVMKFFTKKYPKDFMRIEPRKAIAKLSRANYIVNNIEEGFDISEEVMSLMFNYKNKIVIDQREAEAMLSTYDWYRKPYDKGRFDFQTPAIVRIISDNVCCVLDQGLGKTYIALTAFDVLKSHGLVNKLIVSCRNTNKIDGWYQEAQKTLKEPRVAVLEHNKQIFKKRSKHFPFIIGSITKEVFENYDIIIINHESMDSEDKNITSCASKYRLMFVGDESHWFKNKGTNASKSAYSIAKMAARTVMLTGTAVSRDPLDYYTHMCIIGAPVFPSQVAAFNRIFREIDFQNPKKNICVYKDYKDGAIKYIAEQCRRFSIRFMKDTCLNLPGKTYIYEKVGNPYDTPTMSYSLTIGEIQQCMGEICSYKAQYVRGIVDKYISEAKNNKIVLWSPYTTSAEMALETLQDYNPIYICGEVDSYDRAEMVHKFRNDPDCKLAVIISKAGREGLNLIESNTAICLGRSFDIIDDLQQQDRIYRIGQDMPCKIVYMVVPNSIDDMINSNLHKKIQLIQQMQEEESMTFSSSLSVQEIRDMIKRLKEERK